LGLYHIHIFKNKVLYKKLKTFKSYDRAKKFFDKKYQESEKIYFDVQIKNTKPIKFELLLVEDNQTGQPKLFKVDELGRNVKIVTDTNQFSIIDVKPYKIPEKIFDIKKKKKVTLLDFVNDYLKFKELKVVYSINNKIVVQKDDKYTLFSCKDELESLRFLDGVSKYSLNNGRKDIMVVIDTSTPQKKYIYKNLIEQGYNIKMLYRKKTTHRERK